MNNLMQLKDIREKMKNDPLAKRTKSEMTIYEYAGEYFDSKKDFLDYCEEHNLSDDTIYHVNKLEYFRKIGDKSDVIYIDYDGNDYFVCAKDEDGYSQYNIVKSIASGKSVWEYTFGNISEYYKAFRDRGIVFENDVYAKVARKYKRIAEMAR